jgi:ATP-dependent helicase/nuclease subunit A
MTPAPACSHDSRVDHRVVMASAGTGKTHRLTNRLITLLTRGVPPSEVVATTFTRKAAGEILERVVERLVRAVSDDTARAALADPGVLPPTAEQCLDAMASIARHLDRIGILTIDSFFQRMAHALALEIGAVDRRIADDAEDAALRDEALAIALERANRAELLALVRVLFDGQPAAGLAGRLRSTIDTGLLLLHETRRQPELWAIPSLGEHPERDGLLAPASIGILAAGLRSAPPPTKKNGEPMSKWAPAMDLAARALESHDLESLLERLARIRETRAFYGTPVPDQTLTRIDHACDRACTVLRLRLNNRTIATRTLLERFADVYESLKAERSIWRFEDVPRILLSRVGSASLDRLYYHLDGRVRHLLLDEFQDTSMTAFRLLEPLIDEIVSAEPPERTFFCVGDVKQSLYVWNGAEPELLPAMTERWPQVRSESIGVSRRSSPAIIQAVNLTLGRLCADDLSGREGVAKQWADQFPLHEAHDASMPGEVRIVVSTRQPQKRASTPSDADDDPGIAERDIAATVERVRAIRSMSRTCSIAVLTRTNRRVAGVIHALRAAGIESSEEGSGSLLDSAPVAVLRSIFHLADHPADTAARYHVACSPLGAALGLVSEGRAVPSEASALTLSAELRRRIEESGLAQTALWIRSLSMHAIDDRDCSRLDAAIAAARSLDQRIGSGASDFVRMIDAARVRSVSDAEVRVMTIHASKGLEFDTVVLSENAWGMRGRAREILAERPHPLGPIERVTCAPSAALGRCEPVLASIVDHARDRLLSESLCLLYVAMTRARHVLEVIVSGPSVKRASDPSSGIYPGRLIVAALRPDLFDDDSVGVFDVECVGVGTDWPRAVAERDARAPTPRPATALLPLKLAPPGAAARASGRLARVSPSSLEGGDERVIRDILRPASAAGRNKGTALHAMFEAVAWLDDGPPSSDELERIARDQCDAPDETQTLLDAFARAIGHPEIATALSRTSIPLVPGESVELWRERPFAARMEGLDGEPSLISGRFDRVAIVRDSDGRPLRAQLIDFKTDAVAPGPALNERVAHYEPQVRAYMGALASVLRLAPERVGATLLFTDSGVAVRSTRPDSVGVS